ncbi:helix-turn-helix domain-containing protein [Phocaeicola vulgatus]|uniref:helix-turn-helix domain-containing protein n=1 Tax=Phocaeicola vulgatus TaxID=821 RepID=UPI001E30F983|nr:helix-turn-helix domain-containing protein [Phocaeicola vulgatus]BDC06778.1 DNA-binding protein [Phocaeicola vulgatus]BDC10963.1 DNA-binding protein [Phocaeicola vulgatus]BDC15132.1 DNA-binding protein [Phocaeicola vulgatus]
MEIINIEATTFNAMLSAWDNLKGKLERLEKLVVLTESEKWLGDKEVCKYLRISQSSLVNLRKKKMIAFTKTVNGIRYRKQDVVSLLNAIKK